MIKIMKYGEIPDSEIFARAVPETDVEKTVSEILEKVRKKGDSALREYTERFDRVKLESLEVTGEEISKAFETVEPEFIKVLKQAEANISKFHSRQVRNSFIINDSDGIVMGQKVIPLDRAGIYVPGGTAAYQDPVWFGGRCLRE